MFSLKIPISCRVWGVNFVKSTIFDVKCRIQLGNATANLQRGFEKGKDSYYE